MWISKKKWNEMCDMIDFLEMRTNRLVELEKRLIEAEAKLKESEEIIEGLKLIHNEKVNREQYFDISLMDFNSGKSGWTNKIKKSYSHSPESVNTKTVPNVTIEELTRLVIDGTPIERKENVEMTSKFYRR